MSAAAKNVGFSRAHALYQTADVRVIERFAIDRCRIPGIELMERAGRRAWQCARTRWPRLSKIAVLCGSGNNGGDGFVVARLAAQAGLQPQVFALGALEQIQGDAKIALHRLTEFGVTIRPAQEFHGAEFELIVDGLFGTGLSRALQGQAARLVHLANSARAARLALDVPSGLHADTGGALGEVFVSHLTVSFVGQKQGLFTADGRKYSGHVIFDDLQIPSLAYETVPVRGWRLTLASLLAARERPLGARDVRAHKGDFGHVLVVGGEHGFGGAARLCAEAAARCGAGLISVATRAVHVPALIAARAELMAHAVERADQLQGLVDAASVVAVGPGLGRTPWAQQLLATTLASAKPVVVDADALNLIAGKHLNLLPAQCVLTPHPGEAARLLNATTEAVEADRFAAIAALVGKYQRVVLLKGAGTLIAQPGGAVHIIEGGNPGMASGGMGDVLTGIIAALLAQGLPPIDAAVYGAALHARAADEAAHSGGERGLLAGDLLAPLRRLVDRL